ncbi:MAG TPA: AraC family transcriptional regulator [Chitinophaga sp.]|uniref:helix-turn-helix transcriptional regulator n=1 Tax=Chitinophaga sp. TaxID=1869181 RepID=UPI002C7B869E|nr:AraC family transcriptional regulator [Chitinophaga sp.]HVI43526.1 AraC family transcriptional regulator [Chitinophaga sp.]
MGHKLHHNTSVPPSGIINQYTCQGDFYQVKDWTFDNSAGITGKGYNDCLCFLLVRSGYLRYDLSGKSYELHSGHLVIDKPDYEYVLKPAAGQCSVFNFTDEFYASFAEEYHLRRISFFSAANKLAQSLPSSAGIDYLHYRLWQRMHLSNKMETDAIVLELLKQVVEGLGDELLYSHVTDQRKEHVYVTEQARLFMNEHFQDDISLAQLSKHCYVSPFYLSRIFKSIMGQPPHKYLQEVRLKHAEMLVKHTVMPVADICYASGFRNTDYFSAAFAKRFKVPPTRYKHITRKK